MTFTEHDILAGLANIISEETGADPATITPEQTISGDLDLDSLSRLTIATHAEDMFNVAIPDEEIDKFYTVADLATYITNAKA